MAAPGSGIKFLGLDSTLVDLVEKKSTLSNNKQEYFTASDIANGITAFDNGIVINETAADSDTRIEGQSDANLFFVDASTDRVGIGTNTPDSKLHVSGGNVKLEGDAVNNNYVSFRSAVATQMNMYFADGGVETWNMFSSSGNFLLRDQVNARVVAQITSSEINLNRDAANLNTRIEGQTDANLFFVDASTDRVGIGTNTPSAKLHVQETGANVQVKIQSVTSGVASLNITDASGGVILFRADANDSYINSGGDFGVGTSSPSYKLDVNGDVNVASGSAYRHNGTAGLSGTYTFGGGTTGDIASMTFNGGILTAVTTVP
jgi:hypothetical protein